jgi:hypothetical protein
MIDEALEDGQPAFAIVRGRTRSIAMMEGSLKEVTKMIIMAMDADHRLRKPFELALKYFDEIGDPGGPFNDCDQCDKKDECEIRELKETFDPAKIMREIGDLVTAITKDFDPSKEKIKDIDVKLRGKGGDA